MDEAKRRKQAYEAIFLAYFHHQIDRNEREARVVALRDTLGAGFSFEERDAVANEAVYGASRWLLPWGKPTGSRVL